MKIENVLLKPIVFFIFILMFFVSILFYQEVLVNNTSQVNNRFAFLIGKFFVFTSLINIYFSGIRKTSILSLKRQFLLLMLTAFQLLCMLFVLVKLPSFQSNDVSIYIFSFLFYGVIFFIIFNVVFELSRILVNFFKSA